MTLGRHPNVVIGLLLAAVALLVVVAVAGLGARAAATPTPPPAMVSQGPMQPEGLPVFADCGRYPAAVCARVIALARAGNDADLVGTTRIVVDDTCPPAAQCDRQFPFDAIVVFATAGADPTGWHPFHVFGLGNEPTTAERWLDEVPRHVSERLQAP